MKRPPSLRRLDHQARVLRRQFAAGRAAFRAAHAVGDLAAMQAVLVSQRRIVLELMDVYIAHARWRRAHPLWARVSTTWDLVSYLPAFVDPRPRDATPEDDALAFWLPRHPVLDAAVRAAVRVGLACHAGWKTIRNKCALVACITLIHSRALYCAARTMRLREAATIFIGGFRDAPRGVVAVWGCLVLLGMLVCCGLALVAPHLVHYAHAVSSWIAGAR